MAGRNTVLVDDFTLATSTLAEAADRVMAAGTGSVMATVTPGVFAECSMERLDASPIDKLLVTDTVENSRVPLSSKVQTISAAPLFAQAIRRLHEPEHQRAVR